MNLKNSLILFLTIFSLANYAQKGVTTFGFQYKPILPVNVLNVDDLTLTNSDFTSVVSTKLGHSFGGVIRFGLSKSISLETGINYVIRNFNVTNTVQSKSLNSKNSIGFVGYELPLQGLIFVQLSKKSFLNVSSGISSTWIASNVYAQDESTLFRQLFVTKKMNLSFLANVGYEFRTEEKGYFYIGVSYNNPFRAIGVVEAVYAPYNEDKQKIIEKLFGQYITLDLKYFFHEKKEKKKK